MKTENKTKNIYTLNVTQGILKILPNRFLPSLNTDRANVHRDPFRIVQYIVFPPPKMSSLQGYDLKMETNKVKPKKKVNPFSNIILVSLVGTKANATPVLMQSAYM